MSSIKIDLPQNYIFETEIPIRITDMNYGGHLGNDVYLTIIHEARAQFLKSHGYTEIDIEGVGAVVNNAALVYKAQVFYGDLLTIKISLENPGRMSCDFKYLLENTKTGKEVCRAQTGFVFFNYETGNIVEMPQKFRSFFEK
ncbi:MAG: acyl-CoA thioesterase [Calditrichaeota bacterium]|nr:MAG: acyl-CoA thioesterase [Calditrichota bacterium]MBL1205932.1 acyl-CoA thioesterase [Calditrichota bacterium]NOG45760.1 acyl-CoA thioesterase [Calditrichota bacterium]